MNDNCLKSELDIEKKICFKCDDDGIYYYENYNYCKMKMKNKNESYKETG